MCFCVSGFERVSVCTFGFVGFWVFRCVGVWVVGCLFFLILLVCCVYGFIVCCVWCFGFLDLDSYWVLHVSRCSFGSCVFDLSSIVYRLIILRIVFIV